MKREGENRGRSFRRATIFNCALGVACLLIGSLVPLTSNVRESRASNYAGVSARCSRFDRATARTQSFSFAQTKAQRRQANLAVAASNGWLSLIQFEGRFAHTSHAEATYSSVQTSHPSDRAPPQITT